MATRAELIQLVRETADAYGIDQRIALAQIQQESSFNPNAVSSAGARGIAQFMPLTWRAYGTDDFNDAFDPYIAVHAWGTLMSELLAKYGGDYEQALREYHAGPDRSGWGPRTRDYSARILANAAQWSDVATDLRNGDIALDPAGSPPSSSWLLPLGIGAVLLIVLSQR
jgi:soluble lytic murein transglycosylase-like protein